jgi:hypothetical protein
MPKAVVKSASLRVVAEPVPAADFKIEDGIPPRATARAVRPARYFPFDKLKNGQSFLVAKDRKKGLRLALGRY